MSTPPPFPPASPPAGPTGSPYGPAGDRALPVQPAQPVQPTQPVQPAQPTQPVSGMAVAAVCFGAIHLLLSLVQPFIIGIAVRGESYAFASVIALVLTVIGTHGGIAAIVLGFIGLRRAPLLSGIAIGLGTSAVVGALSGPLYSIAY